MRASLRHHATSSRGTDILLRDTSFTAITGNDVFVGGGFDGADGGVGADRHGSERVLRVWAIGDRGCAAGDGDHARDVDGRGRPSRSRRRGFAAGGTG